MQVNLLKGIVEEIAGKQAREIVDLLVWKKDVNEFLIAKKLKLTINQTRNILYKLSESGLVSFIRKKDKRKGWYIYFWTIDSLKSLEFLEKKLLEEIFQLKNQLKNRKIRRFYFCKTCNVEVGEETALLSQFTCHECGQVYDLSENIEPIKQLESKINKLEKSIETIREEEKKIKEVLEKKVRRKGGKKMGKKNLKKVKKRIKKIVRKQIKKEKNRVEKIVRKQIKKEKNRVERAVRKQIKKGKIKVKKKVREIIKRLKKKKK